MAAALRRTRHRRFAGRAAIRGTANDRWCADRSHDRADPGKRAAGSDGLEFAWHGSASGLSISTLQRVWRAAGLQPHRLETFEVSTDPIFVAKVRDVVSLYVSPPAHAIVLCMDEKSQIQALDSSQPMLPMRPGQVARRIRTGCGPAWGIRQRWFAHRAGEVTLIAIRGAGGRRGFVSEQAIASFACVASSKSRSARLAWPRSEWPAPRSNIVATGGEMGANSPGPTDGACASLCGLM
jgi:hypothetical protein